MKPLPHHYEVRLSGGPVGYAVLSTAGVPDLTVAPPPHYDGPGDAWSPEHLLLAAVEACYLFTLRAVLQVSKVAFDGLEMTSDGVVSREGQTTRFTEIVLRPRLTVPVGTDRARVLRALQKTQEACLVSASLAVHVRVEPDVTSTESSDLEPAPFRRTA